MTPFMESDWRRVSFVFCHPDDEVAIAATARRFVRRGVDVHFVWAHRTDVREAEGRAAAAAIGVPEANLTFLSGQDGQIVNQIEELRPAMAAALATDSECVVTVAFEQGHLDHDATNFLVHQTFDRPIFEYPMYTTYLTRTPVLNRFADPAGEEVIDLEPAERAFKIQLARSYPSQTFWRNVVWYERWTRLRLRPVSLAATERLRRQIHTNFRQPNLPAPLRSRVEASPQWNLWLAAMDRIGYRAPG